MSNQLQSQSSIDNTFWLHSDDIICSPILYLPNVWPLNSFFQCFPICFKILLFRPTAVNIHLAVKIKITKRFYLFQIIKRKWRRIKKKKKKFINSMICIMDSIFGCFSSSGGSIIIYFFPLFIPDQEKK